MAEAQHFLNVVYGEDVGHMPRENPSVDAAATPTLYSGRIARVWNGVAKLGRTGPGCPLFVVHRGVDHTDVIGAAAISSGLTGSVMGESGLGVCSLIPLRAGLRIQTTEYDSNLTYVQGDGVCCATATGVWRKATATTEAHVLGYVAAAPASVNDLTVLDIRVTNGPAGA
ncbi:MAG: hypothetical protein ABIG68_05910 [Acidobacteriota bacterium]